MSQTFYVAAAYLSNSAGQVLAVRKIDTERFMLPGGKIAPSETPLMALIRELAEELDLKMSPDDLEFLGHWQAAAANEDNWMVDAHVYAGSIDCFPSPHAEIAEVHWFNPHQLSAEKPYAPLLRDLVVPHVLAKAQV